jgi:CHAT domain-containing protein
MPDGKKLPKDLERKPLGLQRPIIIEASMTVYAELKARSVKTAGTAKLSWMGFGDPTYASTQKGGEPRGELGGLKTRGYDLGPFPGTRKDIATIAALFGPKGRALLGAEATEAAVRALPEETPYVHFACHGLIDAAFPMNSALALSAPAAEGQKDVAEIGDNRKDGLLQAWEIIQDVKLDSDCVVLSACETAGGKIFGGEGIIGLTRAFFYAGARSAVVSLWTISDESTAILMEAFYREVLAGAPRDVALQRAQTRLATSDKYAHPFYWAAFQVHGRAE